MNDSKKITIENGTAIITLLILFFLWGMFSLHGYIGSYKRDLANNCEEAGYVLEEEIRDGE
jgi:low affinity Fe/Cu permease